MNKCNENANNEIIFADFTFEYCFDECYVYEMIRRFNCLKFFGTYYNINFEKHLKEKNYKFCNESSLDEMGYKILADICYTKCFSNCNSIKYNINKK